MARQICLRLPLPPPAPLQTTVPVIGIIQGASDMSMEAYNACNDARNFLASLQPALQSFGMPLCVLGCVQAVTAIFNPDSFPFVDPGAIPAMVEACSCLASWTPFGFCSTLKDTLNAVITLLDCIIGLLSDIVRLESRLAAFAAANPGEDFMIECLTAQNEALKKAVIFAFGPFSVMLDSMQFLFQFVGAAFSSVGGLTDGPLQVVIDSAVAIQEALQVVYDGVATVCP